jgi:hypothetical protein
MHRTILTTVGLLCVVCLGCSERTQQEASDAMEQIGSAVESAGEDAAHVAEGAVEGAREAADENRPDKNVPDEPLRDPAAPLSSDNLP